MPTVGPAQRSYSTTGIQAPSTTVNNPDGLTPPITFPWQLHLLLDDAESKGFSHVVSWLEGGTMFKVHKTKEFADRIMPCYFNQTRYKSFQRQLNSYRFHRFVAGKNKGTCYHELFMRGKPDLCKQISRVKVNRGRPDAAAQQQKAHLIKLDGRMYEPVAIAYPSGHSEFGKASEEKACDIDQDSSMLSASSAQGIPPCWYLLGDNRELNHGPRLAHPRMKISNCISPVIASEIVDIFGSHGGGESLYHTH
jgi:hypothetical protein